MEDDEMGGAHSMYEGNRRTLYKFVVGKPEGKRPLGRPRHTWKDTLQMSIFTFTVSPCIFYIDLICTNVCTCIYEYNIT